MPRYPAPLDRLPPSVAASLLGGGGSTAPLAIRPTAGGRQLYDPGTGAEYATDADGYYIDSAGDRLTVDAGWEVGDEVGPKKAHGALYATVFGDPFVAGRRQGLIGSGSDYLTAGISASDLGFFAATARTATNFDTLFGIGDSGDGSRLLFRDSDGSNHELQVRDAGPVTSSSATVTVASGVADPMYVAGSYDASEGDVFAISWDPAGGSLTELDADTVMGGAVYDFTGRTLWIGRSPITGVYVWDQPVSVALGWVGAAPSLATLRAVAADVYAGVDVDTLAADHGAVFASDGAVCGAIDGTDPTALPYIGAEGDGTPVVVAQP